MKLEKFLKLQNKHDIQTKNLIDLSGGSDISINDLWMRIYYKVEEYLASGCSKEETQGMIERLVDGYELRTPALQQKTKKFMENAGFVFADD